jgi:hypothetical protein
MMAAMRMMRFFGIFLGGGVSNSGGKVGWLVNLLLIMGCCVGCIKWLLNDYLYINILSNEIMY